MRAPRKVKSRLGVVPQDDNLDPDLSVRRNLEVYARFFNIDAAEAAPRIEEALELFQLQEKQDNAIDELSGGMKRRLVIARALVNDPEIIVLDEPTTGLDPQARHLVWQKLRLLKSRGVTMLLTTHYMEEAAHLCDRIVIIHRGHVLTEGTPRGLIAEHAGATVLELRVGEADRERLLGELPHDGVVVEEVEDAVLVFGAGAAAGEVARSVADPSRALVRPGSLEDVFLRLTGRGLLE
jgi:lipooligosaccharide transport system ATP-binding protein